MSGFPTLKTGAVLQYPAQKEVQFSTTVLRFIDGSEQRFRNYQTPLHHWMIRLDLLDESELHQLREFFRTRGGAAGNFAFTDPWDSTSYGNCSIEDDTMMETLSDESNGKTSLTVRENRS
jgi:phage-related protein